MKKWFLIIAFAILPLIASLCPLVPLIAFADLKDKPFPKEYKTESFSVYFSPRYPLIIGEKTKIELKTPLWAEAVTLFFNQDRVALFEKNKAWVGEYAVPLNLAEGWQPLKIRIKFKMAYLDDLMNKFGQFLNQIKIVKYEGKYTLEGNMRCRVFKKETLFPPTEIETAEAEEVTFPETLEIITTPEVVPTEEVGLRIKGTKFVTFSSKNMEGTKEGFSPGTTREEALRLHIDGRVSGTDVDANLFSSSTIGTGTISEREDKVSILLKRGSIEAYMGDFTATFEGEFAGLNRFLSGARIKTENEKWNGQMIYSTPKGEAKFDKMYGDNTQGPFSLASTPVVIDSEKVYLDGLLQKRGDDYEIDYQAGAITFKKKVILNTSIIQVYYDYSQTTYQHATFGFQTVANPLENAKIGLTYINDSDSLFNAENIKRTSTQAAYPISHQVIGVDTSYISELLTLNSEIALSDKNLNLLSANGPTENGKAGKIDFASGWGPFGLSGKYKRVGFAFQPIADPLPKKGITDYGGIFSLQPFPFFGTKLNYDYAGFTQGDLPYEITYKEAKSKLEISKLPSLEYIHNEQVDLRDPVNTNIINRLITKDSVESLYRFKFLNFSAKNEVENRINQSPSLETTLYKRANLGISLADIEQFTAAGNLELKESALPSGLTPNTKTYDLKLAINPSQKLLLSSIINYIDDSDEGVTNTTDLAYKFDPGGFIRSDGKYTVVSIKEEFGITKETVSKQNASFSLEFQPKREIRLRYLFKPNFTLFHNDPTKKTYQNDNLQAEAYLLPLPNLSVGATQRTTDNYTIDKTDAELSRKQNTGILKSNLYFIKFAPFSFLSAELNYTLDDGTTTTLATIEPLAYAKTNNLSKKFETLIRTPLSEKFSLDSSYAYIKTDQGTNESLSNQINTVSHTGSLKCIWNLNSIWTLSISGAFGITQDQLSSADTYTATPGIGFICRWTEALRVDGDYTYARSWRGIRSEKTTLDLKAKYDASEYTHISIRYDQEIQTYPFYKTADLVGNVEINL